ncbi:MULTISPECIES: hypothetical protein [unclassified Agarivorans]|uniref:hypothetical protein n=1 Tax=unclassified Agarivorans TaxID=2636026 RepID=UPI0026E3BB3F|nr:MULTISPECIES: hypothetical protein [unclassified Agarivorans]MDO6684121.1 hypothetical protein [Agarivorans sp. 3_MG-2023]MDO6714145.1 hypothetical protein [Agarivorans sp. 2_MG-2023]
MNKATLIGLILACVACSGQAVTTIKTTEQNLCDDYRQGFAIAIIGNSTADDSEWYADWSAYLNDFITNNKETFKVYRESQLDNIELPIYSVAFSKQSRTSYLLQETIEPQYYEYVAADYLRASIADHVAPFKPLTHEIDLVKQLCDSLK